MPIKTGLKAPVNPEKLAKVFKTIWIVSYSVLILGFFLIIYALLFL